MGGWVLQRRSIELRMFGLQFGEDPELERESSIVMEVWTRNVAICGIATDWYSNCGSIGEGLVGTYHSESAGRANLQRPRGSNSRLQRRQ